MSENNNPIKRDNNVGDEEFNNILKEVFGQKEKIKSERLNEKKYRSEINRPVNNNAAGASYAPKQRMKNGYDGASQRFGMKNGVRKPANNDKRQSAVASGNKKAPQPGNRQPSSSLRNARPQQMTGKQPPQQAGRRKPSMQASERTRNGQKGQAIKRQASSQSSSRRLNDTRNETNHKNGEQQRRRPQNLQQRANSKASQPSMKNNEKSKKANEGILFKSRNRKPLNKKQKALRIGAVVIAILLMLFIVGYCIYHFYFSLFGRYTGERNDGEYIYNDSDYTSAPDTLTEEELEEQLKNKATELMADKDVMNVLLIGEDLRDTQSEERGNTDVMMMISLNKKNKTITMTSFMRDAWVYIDGYGQAKLNAAYWVDGPELLKNTIQDYYGVSIDRYVIVNFESFIDIIDALDGIDMQVTDEEAEGMKDPMAEQNNILGNKKGTDYLSGGGNLRLNGNQALAFARLRYVGNADYERTERQRRVIAEIIEESKNLSLIEIDSLLKKVLPQIKIDFTEGEVASLLLNCFEYMDYEIQELRIPADGMFTEEVINGLSVLCPDFSANTRQIIQTIYGQEALDSYNEQNPEQAVDAYSNNNYSTDYYGTDAYGYYDGGYTGY